jgi:hypothetical protein
LLRHLGFGFDLTTGWNVRTLAVSVVAACTLTACGGGFSALMTSTANESRLLSLSPTEVDFGNVILKERSVQTVTLRNSGTATLTVTSAKVTGPGFNISGISIPLVLLAGQTADFPLSFTPQTTGRVSGSLLLAGDASNSPAEIPVIGTGVKSHSVDLVWDASPSMVSGYNVYRSAISGGPYAKLNSTLVTVTAYTDDSVQAGQIYSYVATSVSPDRLESPYSNQVEVVIPFP